MLNLSVGELFAGVGGFSLGFGAAGFTTRWQVEVDDDCRAVLERHWPNAARYGDIRSVTGAMLEPVDVVTFGSPCQDLSHMGNRTGFGGAKSGLFHEAIRVIGEMRDATQSVRPRVALWENVQGAFKTNDGNDFGVALDALADLGSVAIEWVVVDARFFGVPQRRKRLFCAAVFDPRAAGRQPLFPVAPGAHRDCAEDASITGFYSKHSRYDRPVVDGLPPLVVGSAVGITVSCAVIGVDRRPRRLTPLESERAMGWPDDHTRWQHDGTEQPEAVRYRQCGNGVVAPVAEWIGRQIKEALR